jgi:hypothetical protein
MAMKPIDATEVAAIRKAVSGEVLIAEDAGYEAARKVWNACIDRRPHLIIRARTIGT